MDRLTDEELALIELRAQEMRAPYARTADVMERTVTELREIRQMLADVASALNVANVPTATTLDSGKLVGLPLPERIALLIRDRDSARKLAAETQSALASARLQLDCCSGGCDTDEQYPCRKCCRVMLANERQVNLLDDEEAKAVAQLILYTRGSSQPNLRKAGDVLERLTQKDRHKTEAQQRRHRLHDSPIGEMLANLVGELHALRNAPTDVHGIASTVERLISMTHGVALAANDTRERLLKVEKRISAEDGQ